MSHAASWSDLPSGPADVPVGNEPRKLYLELTSDCNMDCAMCIRRSWEGPGGQMSPGTYRKVLDQALAMGSIRTVNFSGYGEPMSHPEFDDFLARAKRAGLAVEVITNGTLLDDRAIDRLIDLELDRLYVSLDGLDAPATRGMHAGTFADVSRGLRRLDDRRRLRDATRPQTHLIFVAARRNLHELPELRALAIALGFSSILVTNLIPHTPDLADEILYERCGTASRRQEGESPWNPCVDLPLLDACRETSAVVERLRGTGTHLRSVGADMAGAGPRCRFVTEGRFAVRHDGAVSPCLPLLHTHRYYFRRRERRIQAYHLGNMHDRTLGELWASPEWAAFRRRVREFAFSPCIDCGACELRDTNAQDCTGEEFPRCGECLWAAGIVQCP